MSHVTTINTEIKDLNALSKACEELGLELVMNQRTYKWFGQFMGDAPLPEGFTRKELGKCEHAIRVKGAKRDTYEVGLVKRRDGREGFTLLFDYWNDGFGLMPKIGEGAKTLTREYTLQTAMTKMRQKGFNVVRSLHPVTNKPMMRAKQRV